MPLGHRIQNIAETAVHFPNAICSPGKQCVRVSHSIFLIYLIDYKGYRTLSTYVNYTEHWRTRLRVKDVDMTWCLSAF
jgi:hypothetical protein